jgi:hypothetical protein
MALGCGLTSVRGNRGENYKNEPLVRQKHTKIIKKIFGTFLNLEPEPEPRERTRFWFRFWF